MLVGKWTPDDLLAYIYKSKFLTSKYPEFIEESLYEKMYVANEFNIDEVEMYL